MQAMLPVGFPYHHFNENILVQPQVGGVCFSFVLLIKNMLFIKKQNAFDSDL